MDGQTEGPIYTSHLVADKTKHQLYSFEAIPEFNDTMTRQSPNLSTQHKNKLQLPCFVAIQNLNNTITRQSPNLSNQTSLKHWP